MLKTIRKEKQNALLDGSEDDLCFPPDSLEETTGSNLLDAIIDSLIEDDNSWECTLEDGCESLLHQPTSLTLSIHTGKYGYPDMTWLMDNQQMLIASMPFHSRYDKEKDKLAKLAIIELNKRGKRNTF